MRRFFIYRYRRFGTGIYVTYGDPISKYFYLHRPWTYESSDPYTEHWSMNRNLEADVFFDPEKYIEVPEEVIQHLNTPEYLNGNNGFEDRLPLPALSRLGPRPERRVKGSNTKHKIGVPKNKLP